MTWTTINSLVRLGKIWEQPATNCNRSCLNSLPLRKEPQINILTGNMTVGGRT